MTTKFDKMCENVLGAPNPSQPTKPSQPTQTSQPNQQGQPAKPSPEMQQITDLLSKMDQKGLQTLIQHLTQSNAAGKPTA